jgi:hypothetical protein
VVVNIFLGDVGGVFMATFAAASGSVGGIIRNYENNK